MIDCHLFQPVVVCMDLVAPLTGSVVYDMGSKDSRPVGTMATYTCSTGYMVVGSVTVTCQADRTWSDSATCECECCNNYTSRRSRTRDTIR